YCDGSSYSRKASPGDHLDRRTRSNRGRLYERGGGLRDWTSARSSQGGAGKYDRPTCSMGPSTEQRATAAGDDSVRRRGAEESGRLGAGVLPGMEESADRLAARCAAGNGRDDAAGSGAIAAHSNGIVRKDLPNADRSSGVSYVRIGRGGRRCQTKRAHSERSARRLGTACIAHGRAGLPDDEGERIVHGEAS